MQTPRTRVRGEPRMVAFGGRYGTSVGYANNSNRMYVLHQGTEFGLSCVKRILKRGTSAFHAA